LLGEGDNATNNARCTQARKATHGLDGQHQNVDRTPRGRVNQNDSIGERRVPELIPVLGSQPARDVSHKPGDRLPLLSARPAITLATLKRAATSFDAWRTEARWV